MKYFALLITAVLLTGCVDEVAQVKTDVSAASSAAAPDSAPVLTSFESGDSVNLAIPEMHCPFGCFPSAKGALEKLDGISDVTLVEQEKEGVIDDRRVVVTFDGKVDAKTAIAALDAVELPGASFESKKTSDN